MRNSRPTTGSHRHLQPITSLNCENKPIMQLSSSLNSSSLNSSNAHSLMSSATFGVKDSSQSADPFISRVEECAPLTNEQEKPSLVPVSAIYRPLNNCNPGIQPQGLPPQGILSQGILPQGLQIDAPEVNSHLSPLHGFSNIGLPISRNTLGATTDYSNIREVRARDVREAGIPRHENAVSNPSAWSELLYSTSNNSAISQEQRHLPSQSFATGKGLREGSQKRLAYGAPTMHDTMGHARRATRNSVSSTSDYSRLVSQSDLHARHVAFTAHRKHQSPIRQTYYQPPPVMSRQTIGPSPLSHSDSIYHHAPTAHTTALNAEQPKSLFSSAMVGSTFPSQRPLFIDNHRDNHRDDHHRDGFNHHNRQDRQDPPTNHICYDDRPVNSLNSINPIKSTTIHEVRYDHPQDNRTQRHHDSKNQHHHRTLGTTRGRQTDGLIGNLLSDPLVNHLGGDHVIDNHLAENHLMDHHHMRKDMSKDLSKEFDHPSKSPPLSARSTESQESTSSVISALRSPIHLMNSGAKSPTKSPTKQPASRVYYSGLANPPNPKVVSTAEQIQDSSSLILSGKSIGKCLPMASKSSFDYPASKQSDQQVPEALHFQRIANAPRNSAAELAITTNGLKEEEILCDFSDVPPEVPSHAPRDSQYGASRDVGASLINGSVGHLALHLTNGDMAGPPPESISCGVSHLLKENIRYPVTESSKLLARRPAGRMQPPPSTVSEVPTSPLVSSANLLTSTINLTADVAHTNPLDPSIVSSTFTTLPSLQLNPLQPNSLQPHSLQPNTLQPSPVKTSLELDHPATPKHGSFDIPMKKTVTVSVQRTDAKIGSMERPQAEREEMRLMKSSSLGSSPISRSLGKFQKTPTHELKKLMDAEIEDKPTNDPPVQANCLIQTADVIGHPKQAAIGEPGAKVLSVTTVIRHLPRTTGAVAPKNKITPQSVRELEGKTVHAPPERGSPSFHIKKVLQTAIYGAVFLASELDTSGLPIRDVALKVMSRTLEKQNRGQMQEDAWAEVKYRERMKGHQNVLVCDYSWEDEECLYLIMPFAACEDLFELLKKRKRPLSEDQARWLFAQILTGAHYLHQQGLAFRDHSLENVLMFLDTSQGVLVPKITDPGQAVLLEYDPNGKVKELRPGEENKKGGVTCAEKLFGKSFRPPEVYLRGPYHPVKVDTFCLGWMLFFTVTRVQPFDRALYSDPNWFLMLHGKTDELLKLRKAPPLSAELKRLLFRMLDPDYRKRPSPDECLQDVWFTGEHKCLTIEDIKPLSGM